MRLLVIDGNAPWVRSLFAAMPADVTVDYFRVYNAFDYIRRKVGSVRDTLRWKELDARTRELLVLVPGWTRAYGPSSAVVQTAVRMFRRSPEPAKAIIFTSPYYADVARPLSAIPKYYLAHDPFRYYDWNAKQVARLEEQLIDECDATLAIARALAEDFHAVSKKPIIYSPNAASVDFIERLSQPAGAMPADLAALPRPIVGCIGQINRSYDWELIGQLANAMPEASFVFIGPIPTEPPEVARSREGVLKAGNVHHLGIKPHDELPNYLQHFDVCFNPLAVNSHNDRRSPLRLFDYLATQRPILSTAVREASEHRPFVEIGHDADECAQLLRRMVAPDYSTDLQSRDKYIRENTWQARANQLLKLIP
jgi:hypothetical protein